MKFVVHIQTGDGNNAHRGLDIVEAKSAEIAIEMTCRKLQKMQLYSGDCQIVCFDYADYKKNDRELYGKLIDLGWILGAPVYCVKELTQYSEMGLVSIDDDGFCYLKLTNDRIKLFHCGPRRYVSAPVMALNFCKILGLVCGGELVDDYYLKCIIHHYLKNIPFLFHPEKLIEQIAGRGVEDFFEYNLDLAISCLRNATGLKFVKSPFHYESKCAFICNKLLSTRFASITALYENGRWTVCVESFRPEVEHLSLAWEAKMLLFKETE